MGKKLLITLVAFSWLALIVLFLSLASVYRTSERVDESAEVQRRIFARDVFSKDEVGILEIKGIIVDSDKLLRNIRTLRQRDSVKAIVVRIDSPGGGISAAQEVYEELRKLDADKPVVASLSSVAASGGYYVALGARKIIANAGTLTGSIGVIMQLAYLEKLYEFIKITPITIKSGKFKDIGSSFREMTAEERRLLQELSDDMHQQFQDAVSLSRKMTLEEVGSIADGRIFSGQQALNLGLVDGVGTFEDAIDVASELAKIKGRPEMFYPRERTSFKDFLSTISDSVTRIIMEAVSRRNIPLVM